MRYKHLGTYRGSGMLPDTVAAAVKSTETSPWREEKIKGV